MALLHANGLRDLRPADRPISDGAFGTELIRRGVAPDDILEANIRHPDLVRQIHRAYSDAGADILTANTFGLPNGPDWRQAMLAGAELVIEAANEYERYAWISVIARIALQEPALTQDIVSICCENGVGILIETCVRLDEAADACRQFRDQGYESALAVTCQFQCDGAMPDGSTPEVVAGTLLDAGADMVGGNCGDGVEMFHPIVARMRAATDAPLLFQPNAGLPAQDFERNQVYSIGRSVFATSAFALFKAGATIVGGCCGTTPDHIRELRGT